MKIVLSESYQTHACFRKEHLDRNPRPNREDFSSVKTLKQEVKNTDKNGVVNSEQKIKPPYLRTSYACGGIDTITYVSHVFSLSTISIVVAYLLTHKDKIFHWKNNNAKIHRTCHIELGEISISFNEENIESVISLLESINEIKLRNIEGGNNLVKAKENIRKGYVYDALVLVKDVIPRDSELIEEFLFLESRLNSLKRINHLGSEKSEIERNKLLLRLIEIIKMLEEY